MVENQQYSDPNENLLTDVSVKLRDIEEKQSIIKDRVLLIGENLISEKEEMNKEMIQIKSSIINLEEEIRRLKLAFERIIEDSRNMVRRNEFEILQRQFKMFQPLELTRISDVKEMIENALKTKQ
jgi:hypothetical protein